jgi:penicillin-binding protein 1A
MMNGMLKETLAVGTGRSAQLANWPAAGKTGTSQDYRDAWFIGYTGALTAGVWFGNDDSKPTAKASGSNLPAVTWQRFMTEALAGKPPVGLPGDRGGILVATGLDGSFYFTDDPGVAPGPGTDLTPFGGFFRRLFGG